MWIDLLAMPQQGQIFLYMLWLCRFLQTWVRAEHIGEVSTNSAPCSFRSRQRSRPFFCICFHKVILKYAILSSLWWLRHATLWPLGTTLARISWGDKHPLKHLKQEGVIKVCYVLMEKSQQKESKWPYSFPYFFIGRGWSSLPQFLKVVHLQSEFCPKYVFELRISYEKCSMLRNCPRIFELYFVGPKKIPQNSRQISHQISLRKIKKVGELLQERRENSFPILAHQLMSLGVHLRSCTIACAQSHTIVLPWCSLTCCTGKIIGYIERRTRQGKQATWYEKNRQMENARDIARTVEEPRRKEQTKDHSLLVSASLQIMSLHYSNRISDYHQTVDNAESRVPMLS